MLNNDTPDLLSVGHDPNALHERSCDGGWQQDDSQGRAIDFAVDQAGDKSIHIVDGNCKANAGVGARRAVDGRVDADQPSGAIQ